jgi:WD40 repeat protein
LLPAQSFRTSGESPIHDSFLRHLQLVALGASLLLAGNGWADDPKALVETLRAQPVASRATGVMKWQETMATSYDGSYEAGGPDRRAYTFSPDGRLLVTTAPGGRHLDFWDVATGKRVAETGPTVEPSALALFPDGKTLVSIGHSRWSGNFIMLWDVEKHQFLRRLDGYVNRIESKAVTVAPDGKTLATTVPRYEGELTMTPLIRIWDVGTGDELPFARGSPGSPDRRHPGGQEILSLGFAPDGRSLGAVTNDRVLLLETLTGEERCVLEDRLPVLPLVETRKHPPLPLPWPIAVSRDSRTVAVGCDDGLVRLWDVMSGREYLPLAAHRGRVRCLVFPADGTTLLSFGEDARVLTWPLAKLQLDWLPKRARLDALELAALWESLSGDDPLVRHVSIRVLAAAPESALPFLRERLRKTPPINTAGVKQLVADLDKDDYEERRAAAVRLKKYGPLAIPALQEAARDDRHEAAGRVLVRLYEDYPSPAQLQEVRALEVLERLGSADARRLLKDLSEGAAESLLTRAAEASLHRLGKERLAPRDAEPEVLWEELASDDAAKAFAALRGLATRPRIAVPLLRERLKGTAALEKFDAGARAGRALEVLERIGDDEARRALAMLRDEAKSLAFKEAVSGTLRRLGK